MISDAFWNFLNIIMIVGIIYLGVVAFAHFADIEHPVYEELRQELKNPTPRLVYINKYKTFKEKLERSRGAGNNYFHPPSSFKAAPHDIKKNNKNFGMR